MANIAEEKHFTMAVNSSNNIFIVIPVFNEHAIIKKVINDLLRSTYMIVIVDDGSGIDLRTVFNRQNNIFVLRHKVNLGQGAALQTGIDYALTKGAGIIVTFDGDGQHSPNDLPDMLAPLLNNEAEITLASRFIKKGSHNASPIKQFILKGGRWINYFFTGLYLSDSHNGLRAFTRRAAQKVHLKENRMAHATEILYMIRKHKLKFKEVPASVIYTEYSKNKGQSIFNSIRIFFDLILHKLFE